MSLLNKNAIVFVPQDEKLDLVIKRLEYLEKENKQLRVITHRLHEKITNLRDYVLEHEVECSSCKGTGWIHSEYENDCGGTSKDDKVCYCRTNKTRMINSIERDCESDTDDDE